MDLETKYQQMTDKEHILQKPDTYMGSIELVSSKMWIFDETKIIEKTIDYIPGFFKLIDEAIVNCRDHVVRMSADVANQQVTEISVNVEADGTIVMTNNGNGIDIVKHPTYNVWIPEMIFAQLRSSTNYVKEKTIIGGKNGYGVKIVFIWSSECSIDTVDHVRGQKYIQRFSNNLDIVHPPKITACKTKPYTTIRFKPDYTRFGIPGISEDVMNLIKKRTYDIAAITDKSVKVKWNGEPVPIKSFSQYIDLYIGPKETPRVYEGEGRWEYAIALSSEFTQVSFVNGISTSKGGKHVEYITSQIIRKLTEYIEKKKKVKVSPTSIKEQLMLFLRCDIENPSFDSQTKDFMNTPFSKFGSACTVSDKFIEKVAKLGVMDTACSITEIKDNKQMKKTDGTKSKNIRGIAKLHDANWAGTDKSHLCSIIICEGDSAMTGIKSGLDTLDRNTIGVYPLKGKMLNVRGEDVKRISDNKEITEFKKILGLETGKTYTPEDVQKHLRYSKVWILCDQDTDGSHIKGLCINMFHTLWPSLTRIPHFINFMNTPIIKSTKGSNQVSFYNENEFRLWQESTPGASSWKVKYYKGLGTSDRKEFQEYLKIRKLVGFEHSEECDETIDMIFNKKRAEDRKVWLADYDRTSCLDTNDTRVTYTEFIHKELKHFSNADNDRSIPSLVDGLKESQRKVIYGVFKRNLVNECKVSQLSGYISEHSCYHHGEMSLNQTIIGMAQDFVGSNNINLLLPKGQFGTRLKGGKDHASTRYIFTALNPLTRMIFPLEDDAVLHYLEDDGTPIEPDFYVPIIPMVLVNGAKGIGTGYSTDILCYNPTDIIQYIQDKLQVKEACENFVPYYEGFRGTTRDLGGRYLFKGKYQIIGKDKLEITELPVGTWNDDYREFLESLTETTDKNGNKITPIIKDYDDLGSDISVHFIITLHKGKLETLQDTKSGDYDTIEKTFKLYSLHSTTNMHIFNEEGKLLKYAKVHEIIDDYMKIRYTTYEKRKAHIIERLTGQLLFLENRVRYIEEILKGTMDLRGRGSDLIHALLEGKGYSKLGETNDYKYLTRMYMDSVTKENVEKIKKELDSKKTELDVIVNTTIEELWLRELDVLSHKLSEIKMKVHQVKPKKLK